MKKIPESKPPPADPTYCSLRIDKGQKALPEVEGWDYVLHKKQLVPDPQKNDLMHKFIDKFMELTSDDPTTTAKKSGPVPTTKLPAAAKKSHEEFKDHEEGYSILEAIQASQTKQRQQKQTNYIIDDPAEIKPENCAPEEIADLDYVRGREKYSQSVIVPVCSESEDVKKSTTKNESTSRRKTAHRRMESRSFDVSSIKKIMSIDLETVDFKVGLKREPKKK